MPISLLREFKKDKWLYENLLTLPATNILHRKEQHLLLIDVTVTKYLFSFLTLNLGTVCHKQNLTCLWIFNGQPIASQSALKSSLSMA